MNENNNISTNTVKRTKNKKFNFIDALLIVVAVTVAATLVYVFLPSSFFKKLLSDDTKEVQYTIEFVAVDEEFLNNVQIDNIVYDSVSKSELGKVYSVDYSNPYEELVYDESTNTCVLTSVEGKYNVQVTVTATSQYNEGEGYSVSGTRIAIGEKIYARFPNFVGEGYCIGLTVKEDAQ